jgi:hypothetical protein
VAETVIITLQWLPHSKVYFALQCRITESVTN